MEILKKQLEKVIKTLKPFDMNFQKVKVKCCDVFRRQAEDKSGTPFLMQKITSPYFKGIPGGKPQQVSNSGFKQFTWNKGCVKKPI